jgi:hypothetical protein
LLPPIGFWFAIPPRQPNGLGPRDVIPIGRNNPAQLGPAELIGHPMRETLGHLRGRVSVDEMGLVAGLQPPPIRPSPRIHRRSSDRAATGSARHPKPSSSLDPARLRTCASILPIGGERHGVLWLLTLLYYVGARGPTAALEWGGPPCPASTVNSPTIEDGPCPCDIFAEMQESSARHGELLTADSIDTKPQSA